QRHRPSLPVRRRRPGSDRDPGALNMSQTDTLEHFRLEVSDGVATVVIDRADDDLNTLDPSLMEDFLAVLDRLENDASISAVVITSAKPDFLAGANIKWFSELTPETGTEAIRAAHAAFDRLERDRKSTRLNSSHVKISYAVFRLKKKKAVDGRVA